MNTIIKCKTLLGGNNLDFSIACLQSFLENSEDEIYLEIFEDGSISESDKLKLLSVLKNTVIINKEDRDKKLDLILADYPNCYKYRKNTIYAHKLFDVMLYNDDDLLFIDSDVFFIKKFKLPKLNETPIFMADFQNAYSFSPIEFYNIKYPIYPRVNTGFFFYPKCMYNILFVEKLLSDPYIKKGIGRISWLEQTLWGFLAGNSTSVKYFDKSQVVMANKHLHIDDNTIAIHLVSTYRYHYEMLKLSTLKDTTCSFSDLHLENVFKYLSKLDFAISKLKRSLARKVGLPC